MTRFRNRLVHLYWQVDDLQVDDLQVDDLQVDDLRVDDYLRDHWSRLYTRTRCFTLYSVPAPTGSGSAGVSLLLPLK